MGINVRGHGGYVIAPGTVMSDGSTYEQFGELENAPILPDWLVKVIDPDRQERPERIDLQTTYTDDRSMDEVRDLLFSINPDCDYQTWVECLMAVHAETAGSGAGMSLVDAWSSNGSKYKGTREIAAKWRSFKRTGITGGTLAEIARNHGADLSAIALKYRGNVNAYDMAEAAEAARRLIENHDGSLADAETGEVVDSASGATRTLPALLPAFPPGLVGDIAKWIEATARRSQPGLAVGAALALVGLACGRHIAGPTRAGTALYFLGLAPTGTGKDHPLKQIGRIMTAANLGHHLGPSEFISLTAAINVLKKKPAAICAMDEFGDFMRRVYARKGSPHERAVTKILRSAWSANFDAFTTPEWAAIASETIAAPHLSMFGVSTHEQFYSALEGGAASDGTLNRFTIIDGKTDPVDKEPEMDPYVVPGRLADDLKIIYLRSGEMSAAMRLDPLANPADHGKLTILGWSSGAAQKLWTDYQRKCEGIMRSEPERADFVVRSAEMAIRIATIVAAGRFDDTVNVGDVEFGIAMASASADMMMTGADEWMAENDHQARAQKVLRIIRQRGTIKHSDLLRSMQHTAPARELRDVLALLMESGQVRRVDIKTRDGPDAGGYMAT
ncbi:MAG: PriCT-2 domain-containing protein, partial [Hyphomicrobiales bacterium]|nr:PriCT-2 domain-containing protein [Hyphomicrobiales bacterium]